MPEDDLIVRAKTDREAFGRLYDAYYPEVFRYCMRRLFVRAVAEDIFLSVATNIRDFPGRTDKAFRCWLFRIASNAVHAYLRQTKRRQVLLEAAARSRRAAGAASWEALDWPAVYQAIMELDEREQTIVMLRFFGGCAHDEVAQTMGITPEAVRTALSRTLAWLRAKFNPSSPTGEACASSKD